MPGLPIERWGIGRSHRLLGKVALQTKPAEAAPHFERAVEISRKIKKENELALAYSGMGRLRKLQGEDAEARRYLTDALEIFERLGTLLEPDKVRKERRSCLRKEGFQEGAYHNG